MINFINIVTGDFFSNNLVVRPNEEYESIVKKAQGIDLVEEEVNNYLKIFFPILLIENMEFSCRLGYNIDKKLDSIVLQKVESQSHNWESWSKRTEQEIKEFHDSFLIKNIGEGYSHTNMGILYKFTWGTVESIYSQQSANSYIVVRYN